MLLRKRADLFRGLPSVSLGTTPVPSYLFDVVVELRMQSLSRSLGARWERVVRSSGRQIVGGHVGDGGVYTTAPHRTGLRWQRLLPVRDEHLGGGFQGQNHQHPR